MNYEGEVTHINEKLLTFTLDNRVLVQLGVLVNQNPRQKLPKLNTNVKITKSHCYPNMTHPKELMLCCCSTLTGDLSEPYDKRNKLKRIIYVNKLGVTDLLEISCNLAVIKKYFTNLVEQYQNELILNILDIVVKTTKLHDATTDKPCMNKILPQFNLISVSNCKFIDLKSHKYNFKGWFHGVHRKTRQCEFLVGFITVSSRFGLLQIKDSMHSMFIVIMNASGEQLEGLINNFVLIKNFKVITECYSDPTVQNYEFVLADFNELFIVDVNKDAKKLIHNEVPENYKYKYELKFRVLNISLVQVSMDKSEAEFWIKAQVLEQTGENLPENCFLCFPTSFVKVSLFVDQLQTYRILYNTSLKLIRNKEISRVNPVLQQYEIVDQDSVLVRSHETLSKTTLMNTQECMEEIKNNGKLISFQGVVYNKYFSDPLSSRTKKRNISGFGTPGKQTAQLKFIDELTQKPSLKLFLINWEGLLTPLGLIPYMRIGVRNVTTQSNSYLKPTAFTRLEILSYEPVTPFNTANLRYDGDYLDWGQPYFLGLGASIPNNCVVWGRINNLIVVNVKLSYDCENCGGCCKKGCTIDPSQLDIYISMFANDETGHCKISSKSQDVLMVLLGLNRNQFKVWLEAFAQIGQFNYEKFGVNDYKDKKFDRQAFKKALIEVFDTRNERDLMIFGMKCIKINNDKKGMSERPAWFCVDIKEM